MKPLSCVQLFVTPWTAAYQRSLSMGFSRQEYWSGLPFPSPGDLPDPRIEPRSPALQADTLTSELPGKLSGHQAVLDALVSQVVKRLPATQETRVRSLGREEPLEKEMATHSRILAWRIPWTENPMDRKAWWATVHGVA